jgi:hypothetical protein
MGNKMACQTNSHLSHKPCGKYKSRMGQTRTSGYTKGGIKCLSGVSIPCRPVTPVVSPIFKSAKCLGTCLKIRIWIYLSRKKISSKRRIISFMHSSILRLDWFLFMALCLSFFKGSLVITFRISKFFAWVSLKRHKLSKCASGALEFVSYEFNIYVMYNGEYCIRLTWKICIYFL